MPTPIIPKRRRSLGATACAAPRAGSESRKIEPAIKEAPAAPANVCKNARRDKRALFIVSILLWGDSTPLYKFLQAVRGTRVRRPKQCPTKGRARKNTQQNCCAIAGLSVASYRTPRFAQATASRPHNCEHSAARPECFLFLRT